MAVSSRWVIVAGIVTGLALFAAGGGKSETQPAPSSPVVPERIDIPTLSLKAPLMKLGLSDQGDVELPPFDKPSTAGWYTGSAVPGDAGASVIIGHVDTKTAPAVFFRLRDLRKGALVKVLRSDGKTAEYRVDSVERVPKDSFPAERVYAEDGLRLITCGGDFDWTHHQYRDNVIVYASLIGDA
ncbi:class F sortase [Planotetraspora sp. A-T 1434]|uniref:class F sortase n=1 Tax=Planotetraspora sp. A-T 1434 TaxID=2979219 RepID=UPI0021C1FBF0|nr:class F sortase [Planotetraspora sp. A-T 1434]MCT9928653.1 class F sortase [Planotetraspora sp. A-T 1434]